LQNIHQSSPSYNCTILIYKSNSRISFLWYWGLNSGLHACQTVTLPLVPLYQPCFCVGCFLFKILLLLLLYCRYSVTFTKILAIYCSWIHSALHHSPLSLPAPIPGVISTGLIFPFTYICTQDFQPSYTLSL
jgi:hypothetical protein